jgi:hypothetical protein
MIIPIHLRFVKKKLTFNNDAIIISLTSFPARINGVWMVLASLLLQKQDNIRIILWLSQCEFSTLQSLPKRLIKMMDLGVEIYLMPDNLRSHKKYYYALGKFSNNVIIVVDDDILYRSDLVSTLVETHYKYPNYVICNRGILMKLRNGQLQNYNEWSNKIPIGEPSYQILATGVGGVLFPPESFHKDVFNIDIFKSTCFFADDIWLNFMSRLNNTKTVHTGYKSQFLTILFTQTISLKRNNVDNGGNDVQIKNIDIFYKKSRGIGFNINLHNN